MLLIIKHEIGARLENLAANGININQSINPLLNFFIGGTRSLTRLHQQWASS